eukprot:gb/GECH01011290.1/.p1 GENE.gb/GECH01011290.1/~~gb/GECH01011290.1/.p1  ORF type:complete len:214 (+),score=41.48 gb/GECH01011290.1/:1-642(+)
MKITFLILTVLILSTAFVAANTDQQSQVIDSVKETAQRKLKPQKWKLDQVAAAANEEKSVSVLYQNDDCSGDPIAASIVDTGSQCEETGCISSSGLYGELLCLTQSEFSDTVAGMAKLTVYEGNTCTGNVSTSGYYAKDQCFLTSATNLKIDCGSEEVSVCQDDSCSTCSSAAFNDGECTQGIIIDCSFGVPTSSVSVMGMVSLVVFSIYVWL